jgi:hypothetical protein
MGKKKARSKLRAFHIPGLREEVRPGLVEISADERVEKAGEGQCNKAHCCDCEKIVAKAMEEVGRSHGNSPESWR